MLTDLAHAAVMTGREYELIWSWQYYIGFECHNQKCATGICMQLEFVNVNVFVRMRVWWCWNLLVRRMKQTYYDKMMKQTSQVGCFCHLCHHILIHFGVIHKGCTLRGGGRKGYTQCRQGGGWVQHSVDAPMRPSTDRQVQV